MDLKSIFEFVTEYFSSYFVVFLATLFHPIELARFASAERLNSRLLGFAVISIFVGTALQSVTPNRPSTDEFSPALVAIVITLWVFFSLLVHFFSKLFGGKVDLGVTVSVSLQIISTVYVVTSLLTLIILIVFPLGFPEVYFSLQIILLSYLLSAGLLSIHFPIRPSRTKRASFIVTIMVLSGIYTSFGFVFFQAANIPLGITPTPTNMPTPAPSHTATPALPATVTPTVSPTSTSTSTATPISTPTFTITPTPTSTPTHTAMPTETETVAPDCTPSPPFDWVHHTIRRGDTLSALALQTGTTVARIQEVNCIEGTILSVDQRIWLPVSPLQTDTPTPIVIQETPTSPTPTKENGPPPPTPTPEPKPTPPPPS